MMNIKLKKFNILDPKVKITTGLKTITRETHGDNNTPLPTTLLAAATSPAVTGHAEMEVI